MTVECLTVYRLRVQDGSFGVSAARGNIPCGKRSPVRRMFGGVGFVLKTDKCEFVEEVIQVLAV